MAVDWNLKWPDDVLLAKVVLKGFCKHIRVHACVRGALWGLVDICLKDHDFPSPA